MAINSLGTQPHLLVSLPAPPLFQVRGLSIQQNKMAVVTLYSILTVLVGFCALLVASSPSKGCYREIEGPRCVIIYTRKWNARGDLYELLWSIIRVSCMYFKSIINNFHAVRDIFTVYRPSHIKSKLPHEYIRHEDLPNYFDWRAVNGTCYVSAVTNQFLPSPCGSCWAHASTGALTDRIIIATNAKIPVVQLSPQVLLDCAAPTAGSCHGGSDLLAYEFIHKNGITDVTCSPYRGVDYAYWGELPCGDIMCRSCDRFGKCQFINGTKYFVSEYGSVTGVDQMMAEIYARGPIACSVYAHSASFENYTGGIIKDPTSYNYTTHVVALTGWGVSAEDATEYWIGRNSFGTAWGEEGWFKLQKGTNCLDIEKHPCAWAVPQF